tara:strand:- start:890 stop:1864 length:975 start_codon:yes stop_codon:yes gene_type:complete
MYDISINRTYWKYVQTNSFMRPTKNYYCHERIPSLGSYVLPSPYKKHGKSIRDDYFLLVQEFAKKYKDYEFVLGMSGGIDSEVCAETFYQLNIPFRVLSLRLFKGQNDFDLIYAAKYCKDRGIEQKIIPLSFDKLIRDIIPKAVKYGQFTHSVSQTALTYLFDFISNKEILINSGHNPDYYRGLGLGWWEDSPNYIKYAINTNNKFMSFTSIEPIFCHYAKNHDSSQPGEKDNTFLYESYDNLSYRIKYTGWEKSLNEMKIAEDMLRKECKYAYQTFLTWRSNTLRYKKKLEDKLDKHFENKKLSEDWLEYKLLTGLEYVKDNS